MAVDKHGKAPAVAGDATHGFHAGQHASAVNAATSRVPGTGSTAPHGGIVPGPTPAQHQMGPNC